MIDTCKRDGLAEIQCERKVRFCLGNSGDPDVRPISRSTKTSPDKNRENLDELGDAGQQMIWNIAVCLPQLLKAP
jgi:hypothetical protein